MPLDHPVRKKPLRAGGRLRTALIVFASSSLVLAACGDSNGDGDHEDEPTTLSFFSWDGEAVMSPVIEAFEEEHPNIQIEFSSAPPVAEYISTLQTRISAGTAADVFIMAAENKTNLIEGEFVLPLTDEPFMENVAEFNQQTYSDGGEVYAMSLASWGGGIAYNREYTDEVGMAELPETWEELLSLMTDLEQSGVTPFYDTAQQIPMSLQALVGSSYNGDFTIDERIFEGDASFSDAWTSPVQTWYSLFEQDLVTSDIVGLDDDQILDEFVNGRVAMFATGPWTLPSIQDGAPDMDFGFMAIPGPEGQETYLPGAATPGYAINSSTDNADAARTFLEFLSSPAGVEIFQEQSGAITTTTDFDPEVDPALEDVVDTIRDGNVYLAQIAWPRHEDVLETETVSLIQQLLLAQIEPADVTTGLDQRLQDLDG